MFHLEMGSLQRAGARIWISIIGLLFVLIGTAEQALTQGTADALFQHAQLWQMGRQVYLLGSRNDGFPEHTNYLKEHNICVGYLGGSMAHVYRGLPLYAFEIRPRDSIILINAAAEDIWVLQDWPAEYRFLLPWSVDELRMYAPPFAWLRRGADGRVRGVVVAKSSTDILQFIQLMVGQTAPLGVPWSVEVIARAVPAPRFEETWARKRLVLESGSFRIVYPEGYADDAKTMLGWCQQVTAKLLNYFPDALTTIGEKITVYLHEPNGIQHGWAYAEMNPPGMRFVLPSLSARVSRFFDAIWYQGNIGHEFAHILHDRYRLRAVGVGRFDPQSRCYTPRWFDEGLGEYFRLLVIGEEAFTRIYSARYDPEAEKLIRDGLAGIQDVYAAGAWALRFLHHRYGLPTIRNIMRSPQEAFWNAVKEQTGLSVSEFENALQQWLRER